MSNDEKKEESAIILDKLEKIDIKLNQMDTNKIEKLNQIECKLNGVNSNTHNDFLFTLGITLLILSANLFLILGAYSISEKIFFAFMFLVFGAILLVLALLRTFKANK